MTGEGTKREGCLLKVIDNPQDPPATAGRQNIAFTFTTFLHLDSDAFLKQILGV